MRKMRVVMLMLWIGCFAAPLTWAEITTEPVSIQVVVTNESGQHRPAVDAEVVLTVYQDGKPFDHQEGRSDEKGLCFFEKVPTGKGRMVAATAKHQEMMFASRAMSLEHAHDPMYQLPITVYNVSDDTSALSIGTHHFVVHVEPQGVFVDEYVQIINSSESAVISPEKTPDGRSVVLRMLLPAGFKDVKPTQYFEDHALVRNQDGFIDTMATPPGTHDAVFTYALDVKAASIPITKKASLPTAEFRVYSQLSGAAIEGLGQPVGQMVVGNGKQADYYAPVALDAGNEVSFTLTGLAATSDPNDLWVMFAVIFGVIVLAGAVRLVTQKKQQSSGAQVNAE